MTSEPQVPTQAAPAWAAYFAQAEQLVAQGRSREAIGPLQQALALSPRFGVAWRLLGDIRLAAGDLRASQEAYDRMLAAVVPDPRLQAPADYLAAGRLADAEAAVRAFLDAEPHSLPGAHVCADIRARRGELGSAEALLVHCLQRAPQMHLARQSMALLLHRTGRYAEALRELDTLLARDPRNNRARMIKAAILAETGDYERAAEVTAALLEAFPDQPNALLIHANGLRTLGRFEESVATFQRVLAVDPARADAWWSLANLKAYRFTPEARATMAARLAAPDLDPADASLLHFALAKADEDDRRDADAFAHYVRANALQRHLRPYDANATTALVRRCETLFTREFFAERAGWGDPADDPIFIVGLPRSGSTLVEQILATHPQVEGTRELPDIQAMADWVAVQEPEAPYPGPLAGLSSAAFAQLGHDYLARTRHQRRLGRARFIDKTPRNFLHIGMIRLMLPNARIVDVRRHPLGCCVSAFRQHFAAGFEFAYDLADLGRYYADYAQLMSHYDTVLPGHVTRVIYEQLVEDTEGEVRRLLDALGLPFDPACLRFFENDRPVATPSSEQVRQPIYSEGTVHWRRFEPWLDPLKAALGPVLDAYPSAP